MQYRTISIPGPKKHNQDAVLEPIDIQGSIWCGIADGVGSAEQGGVAARMSLETVRRFAGPEVAMEDLFEEIERTLANLPDADKHPKSISTTLSILCLKGGVATVGHVGDTRITHYRGAGVMARTKDQTEVQKLLDDGVLSKNQARRYPRRNVLLSAMSPGRGYDLYQSSFVISKGDRVLLTSDGFHGKVLRGQIADISAKNINFDDFWHMLEASLNQSSLDDDASCLAIEIN